MIAVVFFTNFQVGPIQWSQQQVISSVANFHWVGKLGCPDLRSYGLSKLEDGETKKLTNWPPEIGRKIDTQNDGPKGKCIPSPASNMASFRGYLGQISGGVVGGWTNPFEKVCSPNWIISSRVKNIKSLKRQPSWNWKIVIFNFSAATENFPSSVIWATKKPSDTFHWILVV